MTRQELIEIAKKNYSFLKFSRLENLLSREENHLMMEAEKQ